MDFVHLNAIANSFSTWDEVYECSDDVSEEEREAIASLKYYGHEIKKGDVDNIIAGIEWKPTKPYGVMMNLIDGKEEKFFDTLEQLKAYCEPRVETVMSSKSFGTDFGTYTLVGATLSELGIHQRVG